MKNLLKFLLITCVSLVTHTPLIGMDCPLSELQHIHPIKYNSILCPLTMLPNDTLLTIVSLCHAQGKSEEEELKNSMKNFIKMSGACKRFNNLLSDETIGTLCQKYSKDAKNTALRTMIRLAGKFGFNYSRPYLLPIYILIQAQASVEYSSQDLFNIARYNDDPTLVDTVFKHGATPHSPNILSRITNYKIARLFIKYGVNLNSNLYDAWCNGHYTNVLWKVIQNGEYSVKLVDLYLKNGANPKQLESEKNNCLLHAIAMRASDYPECTGLLEKAELILNVMPDMVNHINNAGKTPLDIAYSIRHREIHEQLVALFRKHNCLTAQELKLQKQSDCYGSSRTQCNGATSK